MAQKYDVDESFKKIDYSILKRSFSYLKPYPFSFLLLFLLGTISSFSFLYFTKILGDALDTLLSSSTTDFLFPICFFLFAVLVLGCICRFFRGKILIQVKTKIAIQFRNDLLKKLSVLPQSYYDNVPHGKIYARVSHYVDHITYVLCEVLLDLLLQVMTFFLVFLFLISLNVGLTLLTFFLVACFFALYVFLTPRLFKWRRIYQNQDSNNTAYLSESLKGVKITQAFLRAKKNSLTYQSLLKKLYRKGIPIRYMGNLSWSLGHVFETATLLAVYIFGFAFYYPAMSIGSIVIFGQYTNSFWNPISHITNQYDAIIQAIDYLQRIYDLFDYQDEKSGDLSFEITKGEIEFSHVNFSYNDGEEVLHDVSFSIPSGKKIAIVGATGSGKSTIIQLITRLYEVSKGNIFIDKMDLNKIKISDLRNQVMTMNQDGFLFSKTIYDNLVLAKKDVSLKKVRQICKRIHIDDFIMNLSNGYDTVVEGNGSEFSTGQKQMLCIARILIQNPTVAILDEATSNIDVLTEQAIVNTFFEVFQNKTTIVIAHRLSTIVESDIIYVIDKGRIKEVGNHKELLQNKGKYYQLYQSQTSIETI